MNKKDVGLRLLSYYTNLPFSKPEMVNLGLTHRCGLDCSICNTKEDNPNVEEEMSTEDLKKVIDEIADWGNIGVSFAGGEPLLRKEALLECLNFADKRDVKTYMTTNGRAVNAETAQEIVNAGLDFISISLDGYNKKTNDTIRDDGSYEGVMKAIENLKKAKEEKGSNLKIGLTTVITSKNLGELTELHDFALEEDLHEINYHPYVPDNSFMGKVDYENDEFWIQESQMEKLNETIEELLQIKGSEKGRIGTSEFILENTVEYFEEKDDFSKGKCLAGQSYMYVKPNGNVDVCGKGPSFDFRKMNVKEKSIKKIWRSLNFFITRLKIKSCDRPCLMSCFPKISVTNFAREVVH